MNSVFDLGKPSRDAPAFAVELCDSCPFNSRVLSPQFGYGTVVAAKGIVRHDAGTGHPVGTVGILRRTLGQRDRASPRWPNMANKLFDKFQGAFHNDSPN